MVRRKKLKWLAVVVVVVVAGLVYGVYSLFAPTTRGHMTVTEATVQAASLQGQEVAIAGEVVPGSVLWDERTRAAKFSISDGDSTIEAVHRGVLPDEFKPGQAVAVEGRYTSDGKFEVLKFRSRAVCKACH